MLARLAPVRNWIFDLDNTLYPASTSLFAQIDDRIGAYVADRFGVDRAEAHRIQKGYFHAHGTTLAGLMAEHDVDPHEYLAKVHDVDLDLIDANAALAQAIANLPGEKFVFTNADAAYAGRVLDRLGLSESFAGVHDVHACGYVPKPHPDAYAGMCAAFGIDPAESLFADDMARNLKPAHDIGMATLWIDNGSEQAVEIDRDFIDFTTSDLTRWLTDLVESA
jgi:putative hydrolase of the HAD superfamily